MKKVAALLTLLALILATGATGYLFFYDNSLNIEPLIIALSELIEDNWHLPLAILSVVIALNILVLTLTILFERKDSNKITDENKAKITTLKTRLEKTLTERDFVRKQLEDTKNEVEALKSQLSIFVVNSHAHEEKMTEEELEGFRARTTELEELVMKSRTEFDKSEKARRKAEIEVEAMLARNEQFEQDKVRLNKEIDKHKNQLGSSRNENEKLQLSLKELKNKAAELEEQLKSTRANLKGGSDAIPPAAYQILYLLQKEGRLIDLLMEDIAEFDDETLGGALRPIHEGCRKLLEERLILEPVLSEEEGSIITLEEVDSEAIKLSGNVPAKGPYCGELVHRGWRLKECKLPELVSGWTGNVVAPAEIEIS